LESYANEIIVITLTNPLKKITRSCANCDERASCKERNLGADKYDVAAKCERWINKRLTYGTKIYQKPWKRCPTDNAIMQKNVKTGESFCPLCKARKEREARR